MEITQKIERSEKVCAVIIEMKAEIKKLARLQRNYRLAKIQKSFSHASRLTALHRLYLKIRNKPYEEVHRLNDHNRWWVPYYVENYSEKWGLDEIFIDYRIEES